MAIKEIKDTIFEKKVSDPLYGLETSRIPKISIKEEPSNE